MSNRTTDTLFVNAVDTPVSSYAEFRRTAQLELVHRWMREPVTPSKVRMVTSYAQNAL